LKDLKDFEKNMGALPLDFLCIKKCREPYKKVFGHVHFFYASPGNIPEINPSNKNLVILAL